jgi:hypothetical protein
VTDARRIRTRFLDKAAAWGAAVVALAVIVVTLMTHVVAPRVLQHYEHFPALETIPRLTLNSRGVPGDPVNVALVGTETEIGTALHDAGWVAADSLSRASEIAIAKSVLFNRPDATAPVSPLFLFGRRQDLAYEEQVGHSARQRHHVRLWRTGAITYEGRPVWIGGATYDLKAGISHRGLHPTHHIAPDIDQERDGLEEALARAGQAEATFRVTGIGIRVNAHNAEGDRYDTDGELRVVVIPPANVTHAVPSDEGVPFVVALKDRVWAFGHRAVRP